MTIASVLVLACVLLPTLVQVGYSLVFFLEYLGPFLIYPFFWARGARSLVYGVDPDEYPRLAVQDLACFYWCIHYFKVCSFSAISFCCSGSARLICRL